MSEIGRGVDALGLFLSGGSSNANPDLSLGGAPSSTRIHGMGPIITDPIPSIRIDEVYPANGEGEATLVVGTDGKITYTAPSGGSSDPSIIVAGETRVLANRDDKNEAIKVYRESGLDHSAQTSSLGLVYPINGAMGHANVSDAQRQAGRTTYRAIFLQAQGDFEVRDIKLWLPLVSGFQAFFALALETPSGGSIQTIADEVTAPTGLSWSSPDSEGSALTHSTLDAGDYLGLWIRRIFPAGGVVNPRENVRLAIKFRGA